MHDEVEAVFEAPTLEALARRIEAAQAAPAAPAVAGIKRADRTRRQRQEVRA